MNTTLLIWALWVAAGGPVNSGDRTLVQPYVAAYFATKEDCTRVQQLVRWHSRWAQCVEATYVMPPAANIVK
jgi:hypothetical protein